MQKVLEEFNNQTLRRFSLGDHSAFEDVFTLLYEDGVQWANSCLYHKYPITARRLTAEALFMSFCNSKHRDFTSLGQIKTFLVTTIRDNCKSYFNARERIRKLPDHKINPLYYRNLPAETLGKIFMIIE